ncbi:uncharacterized protein LOC136075223 [Hydra vulgaris]|uniref:Uncharacterized protein LOC136075223 n=1 Tax=Hydra vulgaris TaxID=6087 RepID=A0ABM4B4N5_HYDVU
MISDNLAVICKHIPREFSRKPRSLLEYKKWKATELRQFLLYTGPVVLKNVLKDTVYSNFLDLSVAIRILLSPNLLSKNLDYAEQLLKYFVVTFSKLYGENQLVYNIHSLIHLPSDAKRYGVLDNVSAFRFESYLGRLKKLVCKPQNPTGQVVRRIIEGHSNINQDTSNKKEPILKKIHLDGPMPVEYQSYIQFKHYHGPDYFVSTSIGDNCFKVENKLGIVKNILHNSTFAEPNEALVVFEEFEDMELFFSDPVSSISLAIYFVTKLTGIRRTFPIASLMTKYILLPFKQGFVALPQMHFS